MLSFKKLIFVWLTIFSCSTAFAITDEEIFRNFQFSFLNPGARSTAMGGAFIGLADDATAAEANPAGLTILTKPEVSFEYRNTTFDEDKLNDLRNFQTALVSATIISSNALEELNQPSFLSVVFPAGDMTFAFSRQEASSQEGKVEEDLLVQIIDTAFVYAAIGKTDQLITNYNFSAAVKAGKNFSLGASLRYSKLEWTASVQNFLGLAGPGGSLVVNAFNTVLDDSDNAFAFNVGALWQPSSRFGLGIVYKRNPKFEVTEIELPGDPRCFGCVTKPGPFPNVLKVPDTFGVGVAIKPTDNFTITADIVRIEYSDLTEGIRVGYNILTFEMGGDEISYKVNNATEFHAGMEGVVFLKNTPIALRQGYYRRPSNSLVAEGAQGVGREVLSFLFAEREDENHFTFGAGIVFGPHFQVDWAWDIAKSTNGFVVSTVARF